MWWENLYMTRLLVEFLPYFIREHWNDYTLLCPQQNFLYIGILTANSNPNLACHLIQQGIKRTVHCLDSRGANMCILVDSANRGTMRELEGKMWNIWSYWFSTKNYNRSTRTNYFLKRSLLTRKNYRKTKFFNDRYTSAKCWTKPNNLDPLSTWDYTLPNSQTIDEQLISG